LSGDTFEPELGRGYQYMTDEEVAKDILRRYPQLQEEQKEKDKKKKKK
jgi:hypothetical protein